MVNGTRANRQSKLPATIVQNHGRPVETLISSSDHRTIPAGDQPMRPIAARSPYCNAGGRWLIAFSKISDEMDAGPATSTAAAVPGSRDVLVTAPLGVVVERAGTVLENPRVCTTTREISRIGNAPKGYTSSEHRIARLLGTRTRDTPKNVCKPRRGHAMGENLFQLIIKDVRRSTAHTDYPEACRT